MMPMSSQMMARSMVRAFLSLLLAGLLCALLLVCSCGEEHSSTELIQPARPDWDTGWFHAEIIRQLLQKLDYQVKEAQTFDDPAFFEAVASGSVDYWANGWFPNARGKLERVKETVEVVGYVVRAGALQGYLIDRSSSERHGVTNLQDLKDPAKAALFDGDGDGRADLIGCSRDWTCAAVIDHHLEAYGLEPTVEHVQGDYGKLMDAAVDRIRRGQPVLFYTWTPNWTVGELLPGEDVVWLEVPFSTLPENQRAEEGQTLVSGLLGCRTDPCALGWPPNDIRIVANRLFLEANPVARSLFEQISVPLLDISRQNLRMRRGEKSEDEIRRHAQEWIRNNRDRVKGWLEKAREAGRNPGQRSRE